MQAWIRVMKNNIKPAGIIALVTLMILASACTPEVPVSYPAIELPLTKGMNTSIVVDDIIEVPASKLWHKTFEIPDTLAEVQMVGWCVASGGARNDVKVLVLDDVDFYNWKNFAKVKGLYQSEKATVANFTAVIESPGKYHLAVSNWFSEFSSKIVVAKVYLYWSVKPVVFEIRSGDAALRNGDFQIPKNAEVTFKFVDKVDTGNFKATKDGREIAISSNITGSEVKFVAPSTGIYEFSCGNGSLVIKGKFNVIPAQPVIGQGLTISSNMANSPPRLDRIEDKTYESKDYLSPFTLTASDPDDDTLMYYAFNLPSALAGIESGGRKIWLPAATLDQNSGKLSWDPLSANLSAGKYYVRFEVSDGVLSDFQNIVIEIRR
jgi:hypothetical protein